MPIAPAIAHAAEDFRHNDGFLVNTVKDLEPQEWLKHPEGCANHMAWIVGHVIWTRHRLLSFLGTEWSAPWLGLFSRGSKVE